MIEISLHTLVKPTERTERVIVSLDNIFSGLSMDISEEGIYAYGGLNSLKSFHRLLREERILDTARAVFVEGRTGDSFQFSLCKQAAFMGKVSFPIVEEPLGSIHVQIRGDGNITRIIDWLAPPTKDGRPIVEIDI
jgi:hypothetical protein